MVVLLFLYLGWGLIVICNSDIFEILELTILEDDLKNENDFKNEDDHNNENDLKNKVCLKN